jgi:hypothetical protein
MTGSLVDQSRAAAAGATIRAKARMVPTAGTIVTTTTSMVSISIRSQAPVR